MSFIALIKSLGINLALLLSVSTIYRQTLIHGHKTHKIYISLINGCLFGCVSIAGMIVPVEITPGIHLDGRVIVVALSGAFTGGLSACIAGGLTCLYRIYLGGMGTLPGVGAIVVGAALGTLFYHRYPHTLNVKHLIGLGFLLIAQGLLWTLALPVESNFVLFGIYAIPLGLVYPAGTVFLGLLLINEKRQYRLEQTLQENEKHLASQLSEQAALLNISHAILEMKQPSDLKYVAQATLSILQNLNVNAQAIAIHRIQNAEAKQVRSLRIVSDKVITDLGAHQAEHEFIAVWTQKQMRYRPNIQHTHPQDFENIKNRFEGLSIQSHVDVPFQQGIVCMHSIHPNAFSDNDISVLQKIAEMLSVGMARVEDLERLEQRTNELETEISERTRVEQELVRTQRLRAAGELSAGISHNLNNILTGILGPAMLLEMQDLTPEARAEVTNIIGAGNRARDLVRRLHLATRGAQQDIPQSVDVNTIIEEAILLTRPRWKDEAESKGIVLSIEKNLNATSLVQGTPAGLLDMIINFIFNAIDALPHGGNIQISTKQMDNDQTWITIQDNGIGMDAETQKRVFEPFFTTKANIGTGLGLATAYNTVKKWGGTIDVISKPKHGTTFLVKLKQWKNNTSSPN